MLLLFGLEGNNGFVCGWDMFVDPNPPSLVAVVGILLPPNGLAAAGICICCCCWNGLGLPPLALDANPLASLAPNGEEVGRLLAPLSPLSDNDDPPLPTLPNGLLFPELIGRFGCINGFGLGPPFPPSLSPLSPLLLGGKPKGEGEDGMPVLPLSPSLWPPSASGPLLTKGLGPAHNAVDDNNAQERSDRQLLSI